MMNSITLWVIQIIIFLIIATIIGLIVPDNKLKKYVNTVIGLLLLLTFAKPLLYFFSIDVDSHIKQVEQMVFKDNSIQYEMDNSLDVQKREIQATQDAYILKEIERQLILEANPDLIAEYAYEITEVQLHFIQSAELLEIENLESITVQLKDVDEQVKTSEVKPIVIDTTKQKKQKEQQEPHITNEVIERLSGVWGVEKDRINLVFEGGTS